MDCGVRWKDRYSYEPRKESERRLLGNGAQQGRKGRWRRKQAKRTKIYVK